MSAEEDKAKEAEADIEDSEQSPGQIEMDFSSTDC